jgi:uncharacterized protein (TIRG00374 family)
MQIVLQDKKKAVTISIIALLLNLVSMMRIWIILCALGWNSSLVAPLLAVTIPTVAGIIPFLPGGLVLIEASMVGVFVACGIPITIAISATILERAISYVLSSIVGAAATSYLEIKMWKKSFTN